MVQYGGPINFVLTLVYGVLLGRQKGRSVEVCNSYELVVERSDGVLRCDKEYFIAKEEQCENNRPIESVVLCIACFCMCACVCMLMHACVRVCVYKCGIALIIGNDE